MNKLSSCCKIFATATSEPTNRSTDKFTILARFLSLTMTSIMV